MWFFLILFNSMIGYKFPGKSKYWEFISYSKLFYKNTIRK